VSDVESLKKQADNLFEKYHSEHGYTQERLLNDILALFREADRQIADLKAKLGRYEKQFGHAVLNCIAGKMRKTKKGNYVIPLIDICNQEYGKVVLEDDFDVDLKSIVNVALESNLGKSIEKELEGRLKKAELLEYETGKQLSRVSVEKNRCLYGLREIQKHASSFPKQLVGKKGLEDDSGYYEDDVKVWFEELAVLLKEGEKQ